MTTENNGRDVLSLARVTAIFAGGNLVATGLRLVGGILTSRAVDPSVLGLFNGIGLVRGYAPFLQGGVMNGLNRELPFFVGQGDEKRARELAKAAGAWIVLVCLAAVVGLTAMAGWQFSQGRVDLAFGWLSFVIPVVATLFGQSFLETLYRTHGRFPTLSSIYIVTAATGVATVVLVWWLGFGGLCLRVSLVATVSLALLWRWKPIVVQPQWRLPDLKLLVSTGLPIFAVGQLYAWWPVLNLTLVLGYAGTRGLGLYAVANMAGPTVAMLPLALGQVVYPRMSEQYGRTGNVSDLIRLVAAPTAISFGFTLLAVTVAWFAIPPAVALILPKYAEGTGAAQWSVAAVLVFALTPVNNVFNVVKKQGRYGLAMLAGMGCYYGVLRWLLRDEIKLESFPQAMIVGRAVFVLVCFGMVFDLVRTERRIQDARG